MLSPKKNTNDAVLAITQGWDVLIDRVADAVADRLYKRLGPQPVVAHADQSKPQTEGHRYDEPGPASVRKWFERDELYQRWRVKKSKLQELEALGRLQAWRPGPQKVLYFWAYVWVCEGRMPQSEASRIFHEHCREADPPLKSDRSVPAPIRLFEKESS